MTDCLRGLRSTSHEGGRFGGYELQPVRLVLLIVDGPQEGENDFVEFPSIDYAVAYARENCADPRYQLEGIEDETCMCRPGNAPTNDAPGEGIDDERHVNEALPGGHIGVSGPKEFHLRACAFR